MALLLQVTTVQNWAIDRLTNYLNQDSEFHAEIGQIKLNWWDALELRDVKILDNHDSTMIAAEALLIDFKISELLPPGPPSLDQVRIEKAKIHLLTHEGDSSMNINSWITELNDRFGGASTGSPTLFDIGSIAIRNSEFFLVNFNSEPITDGLDYNRIRLKELNANTNNFKINGDEISISVKLLNAIESGSNLAIQDLKTDLLYSSEELEFANLNLKTSKSVLKDFLRFEYASPSAFSNFLEEVVVIANLDESMLHMEELKLFAPDLPLIDDAVYLSGKVTGPISDIKSEEFLIRLGQKTAIFGSFELEGLPDIAETYINLSLKNSNILARDLSPYLPESIDKEIQKFNSIQFTTDFTGYLNRFVTNGEFKTGIGSLKGRINYDTVDDLPSVVSIITVDNLDLGVLAEDKELLQKVSLSGKVNLKGNSIENILLDLDAKIAQIGIQNYNYTNITTDATYGLDLFKGNFAINDPNLKMTAAGLVNLKAATDSVRVLVQVDTARIAAIGLNDKLNFFSGSLEIESQGIKIDDIQGIAKLKDIKLDYEGRYLDVGDFYFQSLFAGGTRTLSLNSDYIVAAASGQFNLEQMGKDLKILFDQYSGIVLNEEV